MEVFGGEETRHHAGDGGDGDPAVRRAERDRYVGRNARWAGGRPASRTGAGAGRADRPVAAARAGDLRPDAKIAWHSRTLCATGSHGTSGPPRD